MSGSGHVSVLVVLSIGKRFWIPSLGRVVEMGFLDYRCENCDEEEHDICWVDEPDLECVCCVATMLIMTGNYEFVGDRKGN